MTIGAAVRDPLKFHDMDEDREAAEAKVAAALERVGLAPASQFTSKYPGDLSGGQKQRVALARAIILEPDVLIADEPISMLDMSVRAKILELMLELKDELDLTYVYITHDLATAKFFCDRIAIMYLGRIVEQGRPKRSTQTPSTPTRRPSCERSPTPTPTRTVPRDLPRGEVPDAVQPPLGCNFHPRCPKAFEVCGWESRDLRAMLETRWTKLSEAEFEEERELVGDLERARRARDGSGPGAGGGGEPGGRRQHDQPSQGPGPRRPPSGRASRRRASQKTARTCNSTSRSSRERWRSRRR